MAKKSEKSRNKSEETRFIIIEDPIELRKSILYSSKFLVQNLLYHEKVNLIREQLLNKVSELQQKLKEIEQISARLLEKMPIVETMIEDVEEKEEKLEKSSKKPERKSRMDKLYESLRLLDERIKKLEE
ncbi:MAG: hypothetical protein QXD62_01710 [Candidatus Woesearchaeota archaeon]